MPLQKQSGGMFDPVKRRVFVIIGLGLIGGSLAAAIRRRFRSAHVIGVSRNPRKLALAKRKRLIHEGFTQLKVALRNADFVLVCSPVNTIPKFISQIDRYAQPKTIVTDVGSTKREIVRWADRRHFRNIQFVGSHPLAGSHLTGLEHARRDLFDGAFAFVTPTQKSKPRAVQAVSSFWKGLRASVRILSPDVHDRIVSQVSHLPHAVASLLVHAVSPASLRYGASGFLDTTRIAQGDPGLWAPIFLTNRTNLLRDLSRFEKALRHLMSLLEKKSGKSIQSLLKTASQKRSKDGFKTRLYNL